MYLPEPPHHHGTPGRIGVLLINLGTPEAPTAAAVKPYLREFLSDPRVVEVPRALWWPILHGFILTTRPGKSAEKYGLIWTAEGSPLLLHAQRQAKLLQGYLGEMLRSSPPSAPPDSRSDAATAARGEREPSTVPDGTGSVLIEFAMRYGNPSIAAGLDKLKRGHCDRILIVPLYPQYAASSTASAFDGVFAALKEMRNVPEIRTVRSFHDHPAYIGALAASVREDWQRNGRPDVLLMSFHGVPRKSLDQGDPYHCECQNTGRLLAEALQLEPQQYRITFQSRFGRAEWLKPYTAATLHELGRQGVKRVDAICPGFVGDCLETLEEIAMEGKAAFLGAGGGSYRYIPCLNERPDWIEALRAIVAEHLHGWTGAGPDASSRGRALAMGAKD